MSNQVTKLMVVAVLLGASAPALAAPGNGIRLGGSEGRLHPFIELEGRYDSNAFAGTSPGSGGGEADTSIHVRPGLTLSVPGETTSVDLTAKLDWITTLGSSEVAKKLNNTVYADAELGITVNKRGVVSLELDDTFRRSDRPQALTIPFSVSSNYNVLDLRMPVRPGGGALTINLNGAWVLESYEPRDNSTCPSPDPACAVSKLGYNQLDVGAGVAWKFLPRTSAVLEGGYFKRVANSTSSATGSPGGYRVAAGVTGLVTSHVAATVKAGYGSTDALSTWLTVLEAEWLPTETATLKAGYSHDLAVDPTAVYASNRLYLQGKQLVAGRVAVGAIASMNLLSYTPGSETTTVLQASPYVEVEVTHWIKAELAYAYTDRTSSTVKAATLLDYTKSEIWLKVAATY